MLGKDLLKTIVLFFLIIGTTVGSALGLNLVTGPKIAADKAYRDELAAQQALGVLKEVLPVATGFEDITASLKVDPSTFGVTAIHKDTGGKGYVFVATAQGYSQLIEVTVGVSDGKITGIKVNTNGDFPVEQPTLDSFKDKDSTLSGVEPTLNAGATLSAKATKTAVANGFAALAANDLMKAAEKSLEQVFSELLVDKVHGFIKGDVITNVTGNIYEAYKLKNKAALVAYVEVEGTKLAAVSGINGNAVKVYKANLIDEKAQQYELEEVTAQYSDVVTEVSAFAATELKSTSKVVANKLKSLFDLDAAPTLTEIAVKNAGVITTAATFEMNGETYYVYHAKPINDYESQAMSIFFIFDSTGNIYKFSVSTYFYGDTHNFAAGNVFEAQKGEYEASFNGVNNGNYDESQVLITGATITSNALKVAFRAALDEIATLGGNN